MEIAEKLLTLFGVIVTALATFALWRATRVLAVETRRMAAATAQPQIVVSIESNDWSYIHADLCVANTGNSTAFDIAISISPPLVVDLEGTSSSEKQVPFENISLLKPGQKLTSWIGKMYDKLDSVFNIEISWRAWPDGLVETYSYQLNMAMYKSAHRLGSGDPLIQIAQNSKKLQEDIHKIANGNRKLNVDVFNSADRKSEQAAFDKSWAAQKSQDK